MNPLRLVLLTRRFWQSVGSAEKTMDHLAVGLSGRGCRVTVLSADWSVARWLRQNRDRYDLVYVSGLKHEAYAAIRAVRGRVPVVLRAEAAGRTGDCLWQLDATCGRRIKRECMKAAAFVASSRAIERELQAAGYPRRQIHYLPNEHAAELSLANMVDQHVRLFERLLLV